MVSFKSSIAAAAALAGIAQAQYFQRLGGCPTLGKTRQCCPSVYMANFDFRMCLPSGPVRPILMHLSNRDQDTDRPFYRADFLAGQYFDVRLEVHAPVNGSEKTNGIPDPNFTFTIQEGNKTAVPAAQYFSVAEPALERWNFTWYEGKS